MKLFRAIGLILFLVAAKSFLLAASYQEFQTTLSQLFRTTTTALEQTEKVLLQIDPNDLTATPIIDFSYLSNPQ